jgi:putative ABC transport system ATP-binding protein
VASVAEMASTNSNSNSKAPHQPPPPSTLAAGRPIVQLVNVWKTYTTGAVPVHALRGVSVSVYAGEYISIVGPSGSGKSTCMHILGCLDVPTSGRYLLAGTDVSHMDEEQLAHVRNRRIGFVFQQFHLLPRLSAWRNVELPLIYAGVDRRSRKERAMAALEQVGLSNRVNHLPTQLSGGQQQRVAVARALVTEPDLLLADEPTGNLDSRSSADVLAMMDELHRSGRTIVLITHEQAVAEAAERIMRFRDGKFVGQEEAAA